MAVAHEVALAPAIGLYPAVGFMEVLPPATDYARANIEMVLTPAGGVARRQMVE